MVRLGRFRSSSTRVTPVARVVAVSAPLDEDDAALLEACVAHHVVEGAGELVLDVGRAAEVDESLLAAIARAARVAGCQGSRVRVALRDGSGVRLVRLDADTVATVAALDGFARGLVGR
jgi:hypothetical protein